MLKNLPKTSHQLTVCEGNFLRLKRMLQKFSKETYFFQTINPDESYNEISFRIIHRTKHTLIVEAKFTPRGGITSTVKVDSSEI